MALIEGRVPQHASMHYHYGHRQAQSRPPIAHRHSTDHLQRTGNKDRDAASHQPQRRSLEISSFEAQPFIPRDDGYQRRHSGDLLSYSQYGVPQRTDNVDFTSLLVSSAGDILMDSGHVPPGNIRGRVNHVSCMSPDSVVLRHDAGNSDFDPDDPKNDAFPDLTDPYAGQPFSPMDTGTGDGHRRNGLIEERTGDPHLSSSSIHDSAQSLDKCLDSLPRNTKSFTRRYEQPLAGSSPRRHQSHLVKSSSQELLNEHVHVDCSMQVDDLGWLDLNLTAAVPSPMTLQAQNRQSTHSSMGSMLEHEPGCNQYGFGAQPNEFDLIDSLDLNCIGNAWDGL